MLKQEAVLSLIAQIYDAAADPGLWHTFLQHLAAEVNASSAMLMLMDPQFHRCSVRQTAGIDPGFEKKYNEYYGKLDSFAIGGAPLLASGVVLTDEAMCPASDLIRGEFYNDFLRPQNQLHNLTGVLFHEAQRAAGLSLQRSGKAGAFAKDETSLLSIILPHLQRAMQFHRRMSELDAARRASLDATDRLSTGMLLLDGSGRILWLNRSAQCVVNQNDGLRIKDRCLAAQAGNARRELPVMIAAASRTASGHGFSAGGAIAVERPSGKRAFNLLVVPASRDMFSGDGVAPAVIVFVIDPEVKPHVASEVLTRIYDLTPAECRVAERLIHGDRLAEAAIRLGVSHNTTRTHLRNIFQKTGTSHQSELIGLLASGLSQVSA